MASGIAQASANEYLDELVGKSPAEGRDLALWAGDPGATGASGTELSGTGYARKATVAADFNAASAGANTNANPLEFAQAGSLGWTGTATHVALFESTTFRGRYELGAATAFVEGDIPRFPATTGLTASIADAA